MVGLEGFQPPTEWEEKGPRMTCTASANKIGDGGA